MYIVEEQVDQIRLLNESRLKKPLRILCIHVSSRDVLGMLCCAWLLFVHLTLSSTGIIEAGLGRILASLYSKLYVERYRKCHYPLQRR